MCLERLLWLDLKTASNDLGKQNKSGQAGLSILRTGPFLGLTPKHIVIRKVSVWPVDLCLRAWWPKWPRSDLGFWNNDGHSCWPQVKWPQIAYENAWHWQMRNHTYLPGYNWFSEKISKRFYWDYQHLLGICNVKFTYLLHRPNTFQCWRLTAHETGAMRRAKCPKSVPQDRSNYWSATEAVVPPTARNYQRHYLKTHWEKVHKNEANMSLLVTPYKTTEANFPKNSLGRILILCVC